MSNVIYDTKISERGFIAKKETKNFIELIMTSDEFIYDQCRLQMNYRSPNRIDDDVAVASEYRWDIIWGNSTANYNFLNFYFTIFYLKKKPNLNIF